MNLYCITIMDTSIPIFVRLRNDEGDLLKEVKITTLKEWQLFRDLSDDKRVLAVNFYANFVTIDII